MTTATPAATPAAATAVPTRADIPAIPEFRLVSAQRHRAGTRTGAYLSLSYDEPASAQFQLDAPADVWSLYRRRLIQAIRPQFARGLELAGFTPEEALEMAKAARYAATAGCSGGCTCAPGFRVPGLRDARTAVHLVFETV